MEKKYIVGVDFGHGETAAWCVPINSSDSKGDSLMIKKSKKNDSEKKIDSVVYIDTAGKFGAHEAECPNSIMINRFKGRVSGEHAIDKSHKTAYCDFIQMVYERIISQNELLIQNGQESNFYFQIACPTNWNENDKISYIKFFNDALSKYGVQIDYLMNESDAAYFCFNDTVSSSKEDVVLVIDYGSSTIDYTVVQGDKKVSDDTWSSPNLGASEIEKTLLSFYMTDQESKFKTAQSAVIKILNQNGYQLIADSIVPRLEYAIRKQKENFYTENQKKFMFQYNFYKASGIDELMDYDFKFRCDLDVVINDYKKAVHKAFVKLHDDIMAKTNGFPVKKIVLSGGASIMPWVKQFVLEIFGNKVDIKEDGDPGYVVAKGVARYSQKLLEAQEKLLNKVQGYSFLEIYESSDKVAYREAVIDELRNYASTLNKQSGLSGNDIRREFCTCLESLNSDHLAFVEKVQRCLDENITNKIQEAIEQSMKDIFGAVVETTDVKLHVDALVLPFNHSEFVPGGNFYEGITTLIDNVSGRFSFTWDLPREKAEQTKLVEGTKENLISIFQGDYGVTYPESALTDYISQIKGAAISEACRIFKTKDVFKSTFIG